MNRFLAAAWLKNEERVGKRAKLEKPSLKENKFVIGLAATALVLFLGFTFYMRYYFQFPSTLDDPQVPPYFKQAEDAVPFPHTLDPSQFQTSDLREAYSIAKEMPDILSQQPCYCQRPGLRSLLDCFATLEATNCAICVGEVRLVEKLHRQGKPAPEIRAGIIQQYGQVSARRAR
jgi:hypothetical protein